MKKLLFCISVLIFAITFSLMPFAFAQDIGESDDYLAVFSYSTINTPFNSLIYEYKVSIDKDTLDAEDSMELLGSIAELFALYGFEVSKGETEVIAIKEFDSYTDLYIFQGIDGYSLDAGGRELTLSKRTLLYNYVSYDSPNVFNNIDETILTTGDELIKTPLNLLDDYGIGIDKVRFEYTLGTPYSYKILDTNATIKYFNDAEGIYCHTLTMDIDNNSTLLTVTRRTPNTAVWYGIAALAGFAIAFIPLMIALVKRKGHN